MVRMRATPRAAAQLQSSEQSSEEDRPDSMEWSNRPFLSHHRHGLFETWLETVVPLRLSSMDIRQLQYLVALAREKHFTRAAQACHVSQPTLSGRIRQLEEELGVPIVERGQRFSGLARDGERVVKWAHAILDNWASLQQEIATLKNTAGLGRRPLLG